MGEFAECLEGIKIACEFLNYPVVSENVSFTMVQIKIFHLHQ